MSENLWETHAAWWIDGFTAGLRIVEFRIDTMLSNGPTVVTERVDIFEKPDGGQVSLPVLGIFEFEGDKIAKWRDYCDSALAGKMKNGEPVPAFVEKLIDRKAI